MSGLEKGQCLIVFVGQVGECEKCVYTLERDYESLGKSKVASKWKSCVLLEADRQIHCTAFHKRYPWAGPVTLMKDQGHDLGLRGNTRLAIFSYDGQLLRQFSYEDFLSVAPADIQSVILKSSVLRTGTQLAK